MRHAQLTVGGAGNEFAIGAGLLLEDADIGCYSLWLQIGFWWVNLRFVWRGHFA